MHLYIAGKMPPVWKPMAATIVPGLSLVAAALALRLLIDGSTGLFEFWLFALWIVITAVVILRFLQLSPFRRLETKLDQEHVEAAIQFWENKSVTREQLVEAINLYHTAVARRREAEQQKAATPDPRLVKVMDEVQTGVPASRDGRINA